MKSIGILQLVVLIFLSILLFSDFSKIKKKLFNLLKDCNENNKKKGN